MSKNTKSSSAASKKNIVASKVAATSSTETEKTPKTPRDKFMQRCTNSTVGIRAVARLAEVLDLDDEQSGAINMSINFLVQYVDEARAIAASKPSDWQPPRSARAARSAKEATVGSSVAIAPRNMARYVELGYTPHQLSNLTVKALIGDKELVVHSDEVAPFLVKRSSCIVS